ncbi:hypothetical protein BU25DRAFT_470196, partial [Macroventuria anomochaeta]
RPSAKNPRKGQVALSRKLPAPFHTAVSDLKGAEEQNEITINGNEDRPNRFSITKHNNHAKATKASNLNTGNSLSGSGEPPFTDAAFGVAGIDASSHNDHSIHQDPAFPVKPTLEALPSQPSRFETARSMHQRFGELINGREEKQGTHTQSESKASNGAAHTSNNDQNLGTEPAGSGETSEQSEVHTTDADRRGAGEAHRVDPDTAHDSAQVETMDDRDLFADRRDENNIETSDVEMHDAIEQSFRTPREMFGDDDEAKVKTAVEHPCDHRTAASQVGGHNGPLHRIGVEGNKLDHVDKYIACPTAKKVSLQETRRRSLLRTGKRVGHVYEDPDEAFDKKNAEDETRPTDTAFAVPQPLTFKPSR